MSYRLAFATSLLALGASLSSTAFAADAEADSSERPDIVVTGARGTALAGTKTDTPLIETPQPITVIDADTYLSQGATSISDTLRYVAGVQSNPYGSDSRVDGGFIRGINPIQFRDGMRDIYSYYASIRSDPYNFSRIEVVRGPASVLFGSGSIGGIFNMVSKVPDFDLKGQVELRYGQYDRKEVLADVTGPLSSTLAGRIVARARDADTQVDHVPDDRVMIAPSLRWQPTQATDVTLIGLYQKDDGGSTSQFLPNIGTILPNPNGQLPHNLFIGKPGWDRYDGQLLQGTAMVTQELGDNLRLNLKARYIDSNLTYFTHYPDNYSNHFDLDNDGTLDTPYYDAAQRIMGLYSDGSKARMEVFSTDNNVQFDFNTGEAIKHKLLAGVDYSWNRVRKTGGYGYEFIDIYDIDYDALSDYGGTLPPGAAPYEDNAVKQLGIYLQDQIRIQDRVSVVLGVRHDKVTSKDEIFGANLDDSAWSFRAGIIGELVKGVSPFFSYTESFDPIAGLASDGNPYKPKAGRQFEAGVKFNPDEATLVTATAFHIKEKNRPVSDDSTPDPFDQRQAGSLTSKGFEIEATRMLPGNYALIANYSYTWIRESGSDQQLDEVAKHNASVWGTKTFGLTDEANLQLGVGVRYTSERYSGPITTPGYTLVDALAEITSGPWAFSINANNLLGKQYFANCLARGDCFNGADRNVFGTVSYHF